MAYMTKATAQLMRDLGSIQSPQNAFLLNLGLETLHLRVPRHCENAQKVAEWLEANPQVKWVNYCGLKSSNIMNWHRNICRTALAVLSLSD